MLLAVVSAALLIKLRSHKPVSWMELAAVLALLTGLAAFLSLPIIHCFATPMVTGLASLSDKEVWVRFPNRDYVVLLNKDLT
ncbi:MAG TPA: hypothetical protein VH475_14505 [Tepidisphaeraceae bacterium]|jgi:uncharacterized membrane protein HdeD (DUF308 family)